LIVAAFLIPAALVFAGVSIFNHIDDAYAQWGAVDMVIDYMEDHDGEWPVDWDSLAPYFARNNGRVSGWSYSKFRSRVFIDFTADAGALRDLATDSSAIAFDVIHARSLWGRISMTARMQRSVTISVVRTEAAANLRVNKVPGQATR